MSLPEADPMLIRNPIELHSWVRSKNELSRGKAVMIDDHEKNDEVKKLCLIYSKRKITFDEWMYMLNNLDVFDLQVCGPRLAVYKYVRPAMPRLLKIIDMLAAIEMLGVGPDNKPQFL